MTARDKEQQRLRPLLSPAFQELSRKSFEKHAASPEVSAKDYLAQKHLELKVELADRKILYLDTNHWVNLRHVVLDSPLERPGYREILNLLDNLHKERRICCPVSFLLFMELMKQSDPVTRLHTARLMDQFSNGVCFQFPLEMARSELRHFLLRTVAHQPSELKAWVWTKAGFLVGEILPTLPSIPDATNSMVQKAWTDVRWAVRMEHLLDRVEWFDTGIDFWERYATASNADAVFYRSSKLPYKEVLQREKALLIRRLIADELQSIGQEIWDAFPDVRDESKRLQPSLEDYSPWHSPSLQILAGITAADMMITDMKFEANDMLDYRHAALAIPYCNAVLCDNPMATRLRNKPCEFGNIYGTEILGRPEEILTYLKGLPR